MKLPGLWGASLALITVVHADNNNITVESLLKRIEELEQRVKIAERKAEIKDEAAAEKAKTDATATLGANGFQIRSADSNFILRMRGYIQADGRWFVDDRIPNNDTFLLRRVRPIVEGTVWDKFDYRLMLDFGSGVTASAANDAYVQDAYLNARLWPQFQIQAGKFKEPVGLERAQSGGNLLFVERSYANQLAPNRDAGVMVQGDLKEGLFTYAAGIFNGAADRGSSDIESVDDDKDVAARIFVKPFLHSKLEPLQGLGIGIAGTYGDREGPAGGFTSPGQQSIFSFYNGTGTNAVTVSDGTQYRLVPQAYYYWRSLGIFAEYAISSPMLKRSGGGILAPATGRVRNTAWHVSASYFLTGEENSFTPVAPLKPFSLSGGGWGAFEVAGRVSQLKVDSAAFPLFASPTASIREALSFTLGLNWHLNRNVKVNLDYEHSDFKGGSANPVAARDEHAILSRAQISF